MNPKPQIKKGQREREREEDRGEKTRFSRSKGGPTPVSLKELMAELAMVTEMLGAMSGTLSAASPPVILHGRGGKDELTTHFFTVARVIPYVTGSGVWRCAGAAIGTTGADCSRS
jgi:hypothetical protein